MVSAFGDLRGQPTILHGGYFLDDHGSLIQISHDVYERALAAQERLFTSGACVFYCFAAVVNGARSPADLAEGTPPA